MAAAAIVEVGRWLGKLHDELCGLLAPVFAGARSRLAAFAYLGALLAEPGARRSCWRLAEQAGHATPRRLQALLAEHAWDWRAPAPEDPGLVKVSVPEARRLVRLAATPMTGAARQLGYAWSAWRRKHQARARCHHYRARLRASGHEP